MILFNVIVILLFGVTYFIGSKLGMTWLTLLPGILLIYFLPGRNLNSVLFSKRKNIEWHTRLPLDILSSISILSITFLLIKSRVNFFESNLVFFVVGMNIVLAIIAAVSQTKSNQMGVCLFTKRIESAHFFTRVFNEIKTFFCANRNLLIILFIPIGLFIVRLILNPYIFDIDSLVYFDAFKSISATGKIGLDNTHTFPGRESFAFLMMSSHYLAGMGYTIFFKFFTPLIFYFTSAILLLFCPNQSASNSRKNILIRLSYLLVLSSPMLIISNEAVRPETISIAFTIPILVLTYLGIKNNDKLLVALSFIYAVAAIRFHETGYILICAAFVALIITFIRNWKQIYKFISKNIWVTIVIAAPYIVLLRTIPSLFDPFKINGMTTYILTLIGNGLHGIKWNWWWIDSATTAMGAKIGWPGYSAVLYYLYDGITLLIFTAVLLVIFIKLKKFDKAKPIWLALLPTSVFFLSHFSLAEILPRIGIILLPNRSWPYIMLALVVAAVIFIFEIFFLNPSKRLMKIIGFGLLFCVLSGIIGTTFGSTFMGAMVLPQEKTAIEALQELPDNALITSTQRNNNLTMIYGGKDFIQIESKKFDQKDFSSDTMGELESIDDQNRKDILDSIIISSSKNSIVLYNDKIISENNEQTLNVSDDKEKLEILKELSPFDYDLVSRQLEKTVNPSGKRVYFLYSFAKLDYGIMSSRGWWRDSADAANYQFFREYPGKTVAKNNYFILIELN